MTVDFAPPSQSIYKHSLLIAFCATPTPHKTPVLPLSAGVQAQATKRLGAEETVKKNNADMYAAFDQMMKVGPKIFGTDQRVTGTVVNVDKRMAYIDIGLKQPAVVPRSEMSMTANTDPESVVA